MNYKTLDRTITMKRWTLNHLPTGKAMNIELGTSAYWQNYELWTLNLLPTGRTMKLWTLNPLLTGRAMNI